MPVSLGDWFESELGATRQRLFGALRPAEVDAALRDAAESLAAHGKERRHAPSSDNATRGRDPRRHGAVE